ncbi:MAG: carbon starvation protein A [Bacillota bacterium]|nr:carbon starvation protein A [Bacillota bacterium]
MNGLYFVIFAVVLYYLAMKYYATFLSKRIWKLNPNTVTPAVRLDDGFEYVPTDKYVVFGHHFTSIAGAAPIVGASVAAIWGWLPALLWLVLGTIFIGAVHDLGALVTSLRHDGRGIADYLKELLGTKAVALMYIVVFFLLVLVTAVFVHLIATLAAAFPAAVYSVWVEIPLAMIIGISIRKNWKINLYLATGIALVIMYALIYVGTLYPLQLDYWTWVYILLGYIIISTRLPVWLLVQPRDFINAYQLVIMLAVISVGVIALFLTGGGQVVAPAVNLNPPGAPPIWPFVMITIACGATSGWHSIVGSGTTPKQIKKETDATFVGYGGMVGEGYLCLIALLCAVVGLGAAGYSEMYSAWGVAAWTTVWARGGATFLEPIGFPLILGTAFMAVVVKSFAMTTLDSAMRFTRIAFAESSQTFGMPKIFADRTVSIIPGFVVVAILCFSGYGMILWPLFGATNQILAGLALLASAVFLKMLGRPTKTYIIPFFIMIITSMTAQGWMIVNSYIPAGQWLLAAIGIITFLCGVGILIIGYNTWKNKLRSIPDEEDFRLEA